MKKAEAEVKTKVFMEAEVARQIRQHCRTSMKAEVCGVLIGTERERATRVEACIAGLNAAQGGAHVTFTQDTWEHIYKVKDERFPNERIVGWYHSHPGFGVFLSDHDMFIQQNFFSSPQQVAWVYDPHSDEEGCFGWRDGKIEKIDDVSFQFEQPVGEIAPDAEPADVSDSPIDRPELRIKKSTSSIILTALTYVFAFIVGGAAAMWYISGHFLVLSLDDAQKLVLMQNELGACAQRVHELTTSPTPAAETAPVAPNVSPKPSPAKDGSGVRPK